MKLWVTGGGTREPIDSVRYIGNRSTGRLACQIIQDGVQRGHEVTAFLADFVNAPSGSYEHRRFLTAADLQHELLSAEGPPDAVVHSAAVSDYAPEPLEGKVASGQESWTLTLRRLPKVVDAFRQRYPESVLVLFKLETGIDASELQQRARAAASRVHANLVLANLLEETGDAHRGTLIWMDRERSDAASGRAGISVCILDALEELLRERHGI